MKLLLLCVLAICAVSTLAGLVSRQCSRKSNNPDFYSQFDLDYGCDDNIRPVGRTHGVLNQADLGLMKNDNVFMRWFARRIRHGTESSSIRLKPFFAVDIGSKSDRGRNNPRIVILDDQLQVNEKGDIVPPTGDASFEVREIWQPWLKHRCNFAVRYIIPNRINIIRHMENNGQCKSWIERLKVEKRGFLGSSMVDEVSAKLSFRPTDWFSRYVRRKSVEMQVPIDVNGSLIDRKEL